METAMDFSAQVLNTTLQSDVAYIIGFCLLLLFVIEAYSFLFKSFD